jgi:hypothetical protein
MPMAKVIIAVGGAHLACPGSSDAANRCRRTGARRSGGDAVRR